MCARSLSFRIVPAVLVVLLRVHPSASAASYNLVKIADTDGPYSAFSTGLPDSGLPSINSAGTVAFWASLDSGGSGIFAANESALVTVASTGAVYSNFGRGLPVINNFGDVSYYAALTAGGSGIYRGGTKIVNTADGYTAFNDSPSIQPLSGVVAYRADRVITPPFSTPGIWTCSGGAATEIATGSSGISSEGPSINGLGQVAWVGTYGGFSGVHLGSGGTVINLVNTTGMFSGFDPICAINTPTIVAAPSKVAFRANLDAGGSGVYTVHMTATDIVITPIATASSISVFGRPAINSQGTVVFRRIVSGADALYTGPDLMLDRVAGEGDLVEGKTITDVRNSKQAINDSGRITFRATFSDGSSGIVLAAPCPADVDGDHAVNVTDMLAVIGAWGAPMGAADINRDGMVNVADLLEVLAQWGACPAR